MAVSGSDGAADRLVAHARETRVVVIGGGVAGLVAALECAKVGFDVTVLEAADRVGGVVRSAEVAGIRVDAGAESFATRGGYVRQLLEDLGLGDDIVAPAGGRAWVAGLPGGGSAPLPTGGILGIPPNPFADDVRAVIGWSGVWRAYLDRLRPPLTIGHAHSLGKLVRSRMGERVLDRLVAPVTIGVYSAHPDDIDVDLAAPGLNTALTRTGSLAGAVGQLQEVRSAETASPAKAPGSAVEGIDGGMTRLVDALVARLHDYGAEIRVDAPAEGIRADGDRWLVEVAAADSTGNEVPPPDVSAPDVAARDASAPDASAPEASAPDAGERSLEEQPAEDTSDADPTAGPEAAPGEVAADVVLLAIDEAQARAILAPHVPDLAPHAGAEAPRVEIVTLVLDAPALDDAPRGAGVLTVHDSHTAKALTHMTAKWPWLRRDAGGRHVVRVSFGSQTEPPATADLDEDGVAAVALREASALLGVDLPRTALVGVHRETFLQALPGSARGQAAAATQARDAIAEVPGLAAVGAWLAGTGLAQVVPDAVAEADRVRHTVLWGSPQGPTDR